MLVYVPVAETEPEEPSLDAKFTSIKRNGTVLLAELCRPEIRVLNYHDAMKINTRAYETVLDDSSFLTISTGLDRPRSNDPKKISSSFLNAASQRENFICN